MTIETRRDVSVRRDRVMSHLLHLEIERQPCARMAAIPLSRAAKLLLTNQTGLYSPTGSTHWRTMRL